MTPAQYLGHNSFRTVESERWPPHVVNGKRQECFASFLHHRDGTEVFYLRSVASLHGEYMPDVVAKEAFGEACHHCVFEFSYGRLMPTGRYEERFGTTQRVGSQKPQGQLCSRCHRHLAMKAQEQYYSRCRQLKVDPMEQFNE